jgi:ATP-dependent exoDNAse (exonuclease V) beta subunit
LEWPVVILLGLESKFKDRVDLFGSRVVGPEGKNFDTSTPLKDRSVRYMPYPFGEKGVDAIDQKMLVDAEYNSLVSKAEAERRRLLYVAFTRAREQLIFSIKSGEEFGPETVAGVLKDKEGNPLLQLHGDEPKLFLGATELACEIKKIAALDASGMRSGAQIRVLPNPEDAVSKFPLMRLSPSHLSIASENSTSVTLGQKIELGGKLLLSGTANEETVGNAVHAFFGADHDSLKPEQRTALAKSILSQWKLGGLIQEGDLISASDRLKKAIAERWLDGAVTREQPIRLNVEVEGGQTLVHGFLDLLVISEDEVAVIDHKTTNINEAGILVRAREHAPQLAAYLMAARSSSKKEKGSCWLHYPMAGLLVEIKIHEELQLLKNSFRTADPCENLVTD